MKQTLLTICFIFILGTLQAQVDNNRLSTNLMQWLYEHTEQSEIKNESNKTETYLSALIKVNSNLVETELTKTGCIIGTKAGNIWTVRIPRKQIRSFIQTKGIEYIELDKPVAIQMDSARYYTHVDSVSSGIGLSMPYTGKGVIIGIDDTGFDYTHPAFCDTIGTNCRIKRAWRQSLNGTPPQGYSYGTEYKDTTSLFQAKYDGDNMGSHGNMVASIASGSGIGSKNNRLYRGMAYESDLVLVSCPYSYLDWREANMTTLIDGFNYIFNYAKSLGKPAVINASLGSQLGPHDGSSLFSQACDNLTGPGKILVFSGGNDALYNNHLKCSFTGADTLAKTLVPNVEVDGGLHKNYIEIWGDSLKIFSLQFALFNNGNFKNSTLSFNLDNTSKKLTLIGSDNDTCFITLTTKSQEYNKKPHASLDIFTKTNDTLCLSVIANSGDVHLWQEYFDSSWNTYRGAFVGKGSWSKGGDGEYTIGDMQCTKSVITVGGYVSKIYWKNIQNVTYYNPANLTHGMLATFSSHGPTTDNRMKPDITAPGSMIASATNSYDPTYLPGGPEANFLVSKYTYPKYARNYYYATSQGTSFSSPIVAGLTALLLQINPDLSPAMVKNILYKSAIKDSYTTNAPNETLWGKGKLNAYAAIKEAIISAGTVSIPSNEITLKVYPNPSKGKFNLAYETTQSGYYLVEISNSSGQVIKSEAWEICSGENSLQLDLTSEAAGLYFATITGKGGQIVKKLILE